MQEKKDIYNTTQNYREKKKIFLQQIQKKRKSPVPCVSTWRVISPEVLGGPGGQEARRRPGGEAEAVVPHVEPCRASRHPRARRHLKNLHEELLLCGGQVGQVSGEGREEGL